MTFNGRRRRLRHLGTMEIQKKFCTQNFSWTNNFFRLTIFQTRNVLWTIDFYGRCPKGIGRHNVKMSVCLVTFSRPLIGQKWEYYIVEEVIDVDELDEGHLISAATGKLGN